jgi:hypothetical protein
MYVKVRVYFVKVAQRDAGQLLYCPDKFCVNAGTLKCRVGEED